MADPWGIVEVGSKWLEWRRELGAKQWAKDMETATRRELSPSPSFAVRGTIQTVELSGEAFPPRCYVELWRRDPEEQGRFLTPLISYYGVFVRTKVVDDRKLELRVEVRKRAAAGLRSICVLNDRARIVAFREDCFDILSSSPL